MTQKPTADNHTREDVWAEINTTKSEVSDLKAGFSGLTSKVDSLINAFQSFAHAHSRPKDWTAIAGLVVSVLVACAVWVRATNEPQDQRIENLENMAMVARNRAFNNEYERGRLTAIVENHGTVLEKLVEQTMKNTESVSATEEAIPFLKEWLKAVDSDGSRKHVLSVPQSLQN